MMQAPHAVALQTMSNATAVQGVYNQKKAQTINVFAETRADNHECRTLA